MEASQYGVKGTLVPVSDWRVRREQGMSGREMGGGLKNDLRSVWVPVVTNLSVIRDGAMSALGSPLCEGLVLMMNNVLSSYFLKNCRQLFCQEL